MVMLRNIVRESTDDRRIGNKKETKKEKQNER